MTLTTDSTQLAGVDVLTPEQLGHLRHIDNLSSQLPNDWSLMHGKAGNQDDFVGLRFQLAYSTYTLALAHFHRLPNAPGVFKPVFERLIEKMLAPEVWMYWRDTSRGGSMFNAHLADGYHSQWDPVAKDNIMYSAYVQSMTLMYNYLFDDDRYAQPGALTFNHWSMFWGGEPKQFKYDQFSLNDVVYWQMVESGYVGVACEPNCVFQSCNQPAILGFRMHDLLTGADTATEVTNAFEKAWAELGELDESGHFHMMVLEDSKTLVPNPGHSPWVDAWTGSLMNMWNRDLMHELYPKQVKDLLVDRPNGTLSVPVVEPREFMDQKVLVDDGGTGWVATWASEMGDADTLEKLLKYADQFLDPQWRDGGLYYPRNDDPADSDGNPIQMDPLSGNVLFGYARLNVPDGMWKLYNEPWTRAHFSEPSLVTVDSDITVSQARFDGDTRSLRFRIERDHERNGEGTVRISNVPTGAEWLLYEDDILIAAADDRDDKATDGITTVAAEGFLSVTVAAGRPHSFRLEVGVEK